MAQKVLLCDDNNILLELFNFILRKEGVEVLSLPDGRELYATAKREAPALIILDIIMPGKDGLMALEDLRGDPITAAIPVIVVSSVINPLIVSQAKKLGAKEFVEKPFNVVKLCELVRRYIAPSGGGKE